MGRAGRRRRRDPASSVQADGTPMAFPEHPVPHPWGHLDAWQGTTVLKLRRAGDWYSVWRFFDARRRLPVGWYVNFETPVVRTDDGVDVNDLQLDIVVAPDGSWRWKDVQDLAPSLASGRITQDELLAVLAEAAPGRRACSTAASAGGHRGTTGRRRMGRSGRERPQRPGHPLRRSRPRRDLVARAQDRPRAAALDRRAQGPARPRHRRARRRRRGLRVGRRPGSTSTRSPPASGSPATT